MEQHADIPSPAIPMTFAWYNHFSQIHMSLTWSSMILTWSTLQPDARKFRKLRASLGTVAERDAATLSLVDRHLGKLCQDSVLLTSETEWEYVTNGIGE